MEKKALYNLSYGVFMLSTRSGEKVNGCITNTCMQVANDPVRIAISVLNSNYTCDLIKESGIFALSLLDVQCSFETIKHFGFQSGRDVDKMKDLTLPVDQNNIPYMGYQACAVISGKVLEQQDLGTHTLFIAEVTDAKLLNENAPLTYADYQNRVNQRRKRYLRIRRSLDGDVRSVIMYMKAVNFRQIISVQSADMMSAILNRFLKISGNDSLILLCSEWMQGQE